MTLLRSAVAAVYVAAALLALLAGQRATWRERSFWWGAGALLVILGVAKQLQLQDELTGFARAAVQAAGWYVWHQTAQRLFVIFVAAGLLGSVAILHIQLRESAVSIKAAGTALALLLGFVLVRAASLHAVDGWVTREVLGMRLGWWIELTGAALIGAAALAFRRARKRSL